MDAANLPATVGLFLWQSADTTALFADLVNYDINLDADQLRPATDLRFRVGLPEGWGAVQAQTLTPDEGTAAQVGVKDGWAEVTVPRLQRYMSVALRRR